MTTYIAAGAVAGVVIGFFLGRSWAEYFRAANDAKNIMAGRKNYHGKSTRAFVLGGLLILGLAIFFANSQFY
ncbi:hypothetical protein ACFPK1_25220 [Actinomycetospora rhizophila]|uniref:Uncharacterized protein n=1 Tax=Actinomycetospora rhizophila TaxID=1416876 RepID=A0ABV9ZJZ1_9PSEU